MSAPGRWNRRRTLPVLAAIAVTALAAATVPFVLAHPLAPAAPSHLPAVAPPQVWSATSSASQNISSGTFNSTEQLLEYDAQNVTITATNTSGSAVELETVLSYVSDVRASGCAIPCPAGAPTLSVASTSSTTELYFENYTANATVLVGNATPRSALGVDDAQEYETERSTGSVRYTGPTGAVEAGTLDFLGVGATRFQWTGPLGIIPWTVPIGSWNSTAALRGASSFAQNYTVTGLFLNLSAGDGGLGAGGFETPLSTFAAPASVVPANNSSPVPPGSPSGPPVPIEYSYGYGPYFCGPALPSPGGVNGSGSYDPYRNASCAVALNGTELATGGRFGDGYGVYNSSSNASSPIFLGFVGPYTPGPALTGVLVGSDLFGGATKSWPPLLNDGYFGYGSYGPGGPPLGAPGGAIGSPSPPTSLPGFPDGPSRTTPLAPSNDPGGAGAMPSGPVVLVALIALGAGVGAAATFLAVRSRRGPPPGPSPRA